MNKQKSGISGTFPLTDSQLGIYMECAGNPESMKYNLPFLFRLPDGIDTAKFTEAAETVLGAHPVFSVCIDSEDGMPAMRITDTEIRVEKIGCDIIGEELLNSLPRPFDLENGPLCRAYMLESAAGSALFFEIHHIIFDGTSIGVFISQIMTVYNGGTVPPEDMSIFDESELEHRERDAKRVDEYRSFFDGMLSKTDCDSGLIPDVLNDCPKDASLKITVPVNGFTAAETEQFARENGVSENALFLAAYAYTLTRFNGRDDCFFTTGYHGRSNKKLHNAIGMFVRTLPMACSFSEDDSPLKLIKDIYNDYYKVKLNDVFSFGELSAEYGVRMDSTFVFQSDLLSDIKIKEGTVGFSLRDDFTPVAPFEFFLMKGDRFSVRLRFLTSMYTEGFIRSFARTFECAVIGMMSARTLGEIRLLSRADEELEDVFNRTETPYESDKTVVDLFVKQAAQTPGALCLVFGDKSFSYAQVDDITDRIACMLVKQGFGRGQIAGVLIPRCEYMLLCSLGVLKAGGAYLPLDPSYPPERLNLMMTDSGASFLFTVPELSDIISGDFTGRRIFTDDIPGLPACDIPLPYPSPDDLFVMLYTSGSTGTPKGVMFAHSNTAVTAAWERRFFELGPGSNNTAYASYGFDANVFDTYATITSGAALHIIPEEIRLDLAALRDYFNKNNITHSTMTTQVGRQFALLGGHRTLRHLSVAGEKLTPLTPPEGFNLYNLYGPTEGSVLVTGFLIDRYYRDIPIGRAIDNVKLYVVDSCGRRMPVGAVGELWISGAHVTQGYRNRPEKTAEAYGPNPFSDENGYERIYRTGDIVRLLPDGNIQFIGRRDAQVKVRGFRVELTEIEEIIRRFEGITDATVAAFDDPSGGKMICAYVVSDTAVNTDALCDFIRSEKPPYMVPAVVMQIEKIPLNQNQKVNKKALPVPERRISGIVPPETDTQKKIYGILCDVLGYTDFGIDTDIFDAGLTSVGMLKLNFRLSEEFSAAVAPGVLQKFNTIRKLDSFLKQSFGISVRGILPDYPLSQTQNGIFVESAAHPDTVTYNMPLLLELDPSVDTERLCTALRSAFNAHPYAKATLFADEKGEIRARRNDGAEPVVSICDCDVLPSDKELVRPFDLLGGPLCRAAVYRTGSANYLFLDFHHIISDGTSENIFLSDVSRAYAGTEPEAEAYTGFDAALDEEGARKTDRYTKAKEYYEKVFSGCETECLPPKSSLCEGAGTASAHTVFYGAAKVLDYCSKNKLTPNAFFNSVFGFTLSRYCAFTDVVYTTVYNGRGDTRLASSLTMAVKTLPVLVRATEDREVTGLVREVQDQLLQSMSNDIYSFAEISAAFGIRPDIIFVYQGDEFAFDSLCGAPAKYIPLKTDAAKAPITMTVSRVGDSFVIDADYLTDRFTDAFIGAFTEAFVTAAGSFLTAGTLKEVSLLSDGARKRLESFNSTAYPFDDSPAHTFVERIAAADPGRTAVVTGKGDRLTFGELNRLSNRMAHALTDAGIGKNAVVGMLLDRTPEVSVTELAILKAGGAFLGLLPDYPDDRIDFCLTDSDSPVLITTEEIKKSREGLLTPDKPYRVMTTEELLRDSREENPCNVICTDSLCYCIYTSGSTGRPKGVAITHRNLACLTQPSEKSPYTYCFGKNRCSTVLAISQLSFDMSIFDHLVCLMNGMTVCLATNAEIHNPGALADLIIGNNVDMLSATPSIMTNYLSIPEFRPAIKSLRTVLLGAEAFPGAVYEELRSLNPGMHIINGYGPTECTITCCSKELKDSRGITIGGPSSNTAFFVADRFGNILPPYACGELIICGDLVGNGYIKLPEKTAASFFTLNGMRAYRSGDTVRMNEDGEIEFFGRIDNQVKLRGFRIELDGVEKCICSYPGIKQSKVIVRNNGSEDYLCAFFTADTKIELPDLTAHMKSKLAHYMVPDAIAQLEAMPLTPSGKIDKKALPEIRRERRKASKRAPKKSAEQELCELFRSVLSLDEFGPDDNFFEMGGTSLSASKVIMQLMSRGIKVEYQDIFDRPTPEELAEYIESLRAPIREEVGEDKNASEFRDVLSHNTLEFAAEAERRPLGDVLLTGAVGFLGIHILKELIEADEGRILCLLRKGDASSPGQRLRNMLMYYFGQTFGEEFGRRIEVIDADITNADLSDVLRPYRFDVLINCAACVKHYSADDAIERINVTGVENLITVAKEKNARMIQISTTSVPGVHTEDSYRRQLKMHENELFVVDSMDNKYCISKYHAEQKMFGAIREGMRGKVIRVGNLMGRHSDGEFQVNFNTNAFLNALRGFATIGKCPISHSTDPMRFSPVDLTARAIVKLAGTNDCFTAFHADNRFGFDEWQLIDACNRCGVSIKPVDDREYYDDYYRMLGDDKINSRLSGLVTNDRPDLHMVDTDNLFTANVLYRIGFAWPLPDSAYLRRTIDSLLTLDYFGYDDENEQ